MLFTNNAGSSLLQHIAQSYSDIESLQFAELIRDYFFRRKLKIYRFQEELLSDLRKERQIKIFLSSYDPFIVHYCFDAPIQTPKDGYSQFFAQCSVKMARVSLNGVWGIHLVLKSVCLFYALRQHPPKNDKF